MKVPVNILEVKHLVFRECLFYYKHLTNEKMTNLTTRYSMLQVFLLEHFGPEIKCRINGFQITWVMATLAFIMNAM